MIFFILHVLQVYIYKIQLYKSPDSPGSFNVSTCPGSLDLRTQVLKSSPSASLTVILFLPGNPSLNSQTMVACRSPTHPHCSGGGCRCRSAPTWDLSRRCGRPSSSTSATPARAHGHRSSTSSGTGSPYKQGTSTCTGGPIGYFLGELHGPYVLFIVCLCVHISVLHS